MGKLRLSKGMGLTQGHAASSWRSQMHVRICLSSKPPYKALPSTWQASLLLEGSELITSMEPSLTPPGKVIYILLYATEVPLGPSQILPEGFAGRVESEMGRSGKEGPLVVQAELMVWAKGQKKDHIEGVS